MIEKIKKKTGVWNVVYNFIFPLILAVWPYAAVNQGVDITDTTYSLGNFLFQDKLDSMWMLATYIPNVLGHLFTQLPGGKTLLGMNLYATAIISLTALICYFYLKRVMSPIAVFIGEWIAVALCWCPRVILYNYLTYFFMALGILTLVGAAEQYGRAIEKWLLILAGIFLGLNVMVRFPNVCEAAFIVVLWFSQWQHKASILESIQKTLLCIAGYILGIMIPMLAIILGYGFDEYTGMLTGLFGMTSGASDYTLGGMIAAIVNAYVESFIKIMPIIVIIIVTVLISDNICSVYKSTHDQSDEQEKIVDGAYVTVGEIKKKKRNAMLHLDYTITTAAVLVAFAVMYKMNVFTRSYFYYDSIYQPAMFFIIIEFICLLMMTGHRRHDLYALAALMIIIITPFGSNNYTYPIINNLFVPAPIMIDLLIRFNKGYRGMKRNDAVTYSVKQDEKYLKQELAPERKSDYYRIAPMFITFTVITLVLLVQATFFHINYSFVDGTDGTKRTAKVEDVPSLQGMMTTQANADNIEQLYTFITQQHLQDHKLITFGKIPGISFIMDMEPAIFSLWPDLDSNATQKLQISLAEIPAGEEPLILMTRDLEGEVLAPAKQTLLMDYMSEHGYNRVFDNGYFELYQSH